MHQFSGHFFYLVWHSLVQINNIPKANHKVMLSDGAGTRGLEVLDTGGKRDTAPAVDAVGTVGCCSVAGGVGSRGMVVPHADGRKGMVPGIVLAGTERGCTCVIIDVTEVVVELVDCVTDV